MAWECLCCTFYHDFPSRICRMCGWPNCNHNKEFISSIVLPPKKKTPAIAISVHETIAQPEADRSAERKTFVIRKTPQKKGSGQLDIRSFMQKKNSKMLARGTDYVKSAAKQANDTGKKPTEPHSACTTTTVTITPERSTGSMKKNPNTTPAFESDQKPAARNNLTKENVFVKHESHGQTTYIPIKMNAEERSNLPRGAYLSKDTDGPDPNRIIVKIRDDAEEVPDFILDAIPFDEQLRE